MRKVVYECKECGLRFVAYDGVPLIHTELTGHTDIEIVKGAVVLEGNMVIVCR